MGEVKQSRKSETTVAKPAPKAPSQAAGEAVPDAAANAAPAPDRSPAKVPSVEAPIPPPATFRYSGFFDFRYTNYASNGNPSDVGAHPQSGFGLEDGAFYLTHERGKMAIYLDLAFRRGKDVDYNQSASVPNQSSNANFAVGVDRSQLYLKYKPIDGVAASFGQFDTILGLELNDSKDRFFGKTGIVYDMLMPVTHSGAMVEASGGGAYAKAMAVNPSGKGSYGTSSNGDNNTEYGGAVGYSNETMRAQLAYLTRPIVKADRTQNADRSLGDLTAGITLGAFAIDVEYAVLADPNKNTLTPSSSADHEDLATGFLGIATARVSDEWTLGVRYEDVRNDPAGMSINFANEVSVGAHYRVNEELELRSEFGNYNFQNVSDRKWNETRFNVSTLVAF